MTSPAMISPTTEGTKEMLAGMRSPLRNGGSFEYTVFSESMPRFLSSVRRALASGHTEVLYMSASFKSRFNDAVFKVGDRLAKETIIRLAIFCSFLLLVNARDNVLIASLNSNVISSKIFL